VTICVYSMVAVTVATSVNPRVTAVANSLDVVAALAVAEAALAGDT
jgi:hypothetical protein